MLSDLGVRIGAFVAFSAVLGGAVYAAFAGAPGAVVESRGLTVRAFEPEYNATAGSSFGIPVSVENHATTPRVLSVGVRPSGPFDGARTEIVLGPQAKRSLWVPVEVATDAPRATYRVSVTVDAGLTVRDVYGAETVVRVLGPAGPLEAIRPNDIVQLRYVARTANGTVYDGNLRFAADGFPTYDPAFAPREQVVQYPVLLDGSDMLLGMSPRLVGMQATEARTLTVPPWEAFGNVSVEDQFPRTSTFPLEVKTSPGETSVLRRDFSRWLAQTSQNPIQRYRVNDTVTWRLLLQGQAIPVSAKLVSIGATDNDVVRLAFPAIGEPFTLVEQFPSSSRFVEQTSTSWTVRTTPNLAPGEPLTWATYWPGASRITGCTPTCDLATAESVTITHLNESWIGRSFLYTGPALRRYTVNAVDADRIDVSGITIHPFAGQDVAYEVRILGVIRR